jgi:DNA processing protein
MDFNDEDIVYKVAINMIPGVGSVGVKTLVASCGSERTLFENLDALEADGKVPPRIAQHIRHSTLLDQAKAQIEICNKHNIKILYILDRKYPRRLAKCDDAPTLLYCLGNTNLDTSHTLGIVGTRSCDSDGRNNIFALIEKLKADNIKVIVISGLALGADTYAHQAALQYEQPTVAVLGHGLNMVYPSENRRLAGDIVHSGGALLTEYYFGQQVNKNNFPRRNRIIAGLCDALIVAQSKIKGGALITANKAIQYRREVYAFPGRTSDKLYAGCNYLIANNLATLIANPNEFEKLIGWKQSKIPIQTELSLMSLSPEEAAVLDVLHSYGATHTDTLAELSKIPLEQLLSLLLTMEFKDLVMSLPGNRYEAR